MRTGTAALREPAAGGSAPELWQSWTDACSPSIPAFPACPRLKEALSDLDLFFSQKEFNKTWKAHVLVWRSYEKIARTAGYFRKTPGDTASLPGLLHRVACYHLSQCCAEPYLSRFSPPPTATLYGLALFPRSPPPRRRHKQSRSKQCRRLPESRSSESRSSAQAVPGYRAGAASNKCNHSRFWLTMASRTVHRVLAAAAGPLRPAGSLQIAGQIVRLFEAVGLIPCCCVEPRESIHVQQQY